MDICYLQLHMLHLQQIIKSMSVFKKLKGLFIEDDGQSKAPEAAKDSAVEDEVKSSSIPSAEIKIDSTVTPTNQTGKPDSKFVDILLKAVEKNNIEGFDYLEYKSSLQSLANMDMDEGTKYKSALAMATTMGATPDKLISSADHYINVLMQEKSKFNKALKGQREKQVTGREGDIKQTVLSVEQKKKQIAQLQKEILAEEKKLEKLKEGINKAAAKVQATGDRFSHAFNVVTGQIQSDVAKMKKYLK